jgi:hypothetical protein
VIERDLFLTAIDLTDVTARNAWITERCGADTALRRRLELMLQCHDRKHEFLEHPPLSPAPSQVEPETGTENLGMRPLTWGTGWATTAWWNV